MRWLSATQWAIAPMDDASVDRVAAELGIHVETFVEARALAALEGRRQEPKATRNERARLEVLMPAEFRPVWRDECRRRGYDAHTVIRSLVHAYLRGQWEPPIDRTWSFRGVEYRVGTMGPGLPQPPREFVEVTRGAMEALRIRSGRRRIIPVVRGLMLAWMERRWAQPGSIAMIEVRDMFQIHTSYELGSR